MKNPLVIPENVEPVCSKAEDSATIKCLDLSALAPVNTNLSPGTEEKMHSSRRQVSGMQDHMISTVKNITDFPNAPEQTSEPIASTQGPAISPELVGSNCVIGQILNDPYTNKKAVFSTDAVEQTVASTQGKNRNIVPLIVIATAIITTVAVLIYLQQMIIAAAAAIAVVICAATWYCYSPSSFLNVCNVQEGQDKLYVG